MTDDHDSSGVDLGFPGRDPERLPPLIRPAADRVARISATIHAKLLAGFLIIAALLLAMGVTSIVVIRQMNERAHDQIELSGQSDLARQAIYAVTSQSHYRAMALTTFDDSWNAKIEIAKNNFTVDLDGIAEIGGPGVEESVTRMRAIDARYADAGAQVLSLYQAGDYDRALALHLSAEHEISHEIEDELNLLITAIGERVDASAASLASLHRFLLVAVVIFSGLSLLIALGLGAALSWSIIRPVRKMDLALARIAGGDFGQHVEVPNRDEFGRLTVNLNRTSDQLSELCADSLDPQRRSREEGGRPPRPAPTGGAAPTLPGSPGRRRGARGRRHGLADLDAPQLDHPVREHPGLHVAVRAHGARGSDRRAQPALHRDDRRRLPPRRHARQVHRRRHPGVLRRSIPFEDHAERAVTTALEMRQRLRSLRSKWTLQRDEELNVGIGISTGYVTVGNIGSATRTEYTVIGNHVRLASHLAQIAGPTRS